MDIAVIGSNMVDLISYVDRMPQTGETLRAPDFQVGCGGKGANQAVAAARLGAEVMMVTRVGDDQFGPNTVANLAANGVDTTFVLTTTGTSGVAPIFVEPDGTNRILIIPGANDLLTPQDLEAAAEAISGCRLIVLQLEIPLPTVYAAIDLGCRLGIPVLLNPAPATADLDDEAVARCEFFMPNESELHLLTGMPVGTIEEITSAARVLSDKGCPHVIVTLGERGALWVASESTELIAPRRVDAVDSTGAGDAFIGCFAEAFVRTSDISCALHEATSYAADSVTRRGTQSSYATREEFDATR
ncbi:ribokinase [Austwickia chelonae]|uniref:ribokinase n=1 Tax=Austwickia chelonae TaxID=100225 RepID=UPI000E269B1F|nr:ribokinase [Austwickia chelonae]